MPQNKRISSKRQRKRLHGIDLAFCATKSEYLWHRIGILRHKNIGCGTELLLCFWCQKYKQLHYTYKVRGSNTIILNRDVIRMEKERLFEQTHFQVDIILLTMRCKLIFRNLVEVMEERGLSMIYTTVMRWIHQYGSELDKRFRSHLKPINDSWRVDETQIKVKDQQMYLYCAVDSKGNTNDFYLSKFRDKQEAKRFFRRSWLFHMLLSRE